MTQADDHIVKYVENEKRWQERMSEWISERDCATKTAATNDRYGLKFQWEVRHIERVLARYRANHLLQRGAIVAFLVEMLWDNTVFSATGLFHIENDTQNNSETLPHEGEKVKVQGPHSRTSYDISYASDWSTSPVMWAGALG